MTPEMAPWALSVLGKHSTTGLHPSPGACFWCFKNRLIPEARNTMSFCEYILSVLSPGEFSLKRGTVALWSTKRISKQDTGVLAPTELSRWSLRAKLFRPVFLSEEEHWVSVHHPPLATMTGESLMFSPRFTKKQWLTQNYTGSPNYPTLIVFFSLLPFFFFFFPLLVIHLKPTTALRNCCTDILKILCLVLSRFTKKKNMYQIWQNDNLELGADLNDVFL